MLDALTGIIASKKWIGVMIMVLVGILVNQKVITPDLGNTILIALGIGVAGQAIADHGKSAAQINAAAPPPAPAPAPTPIEKVAA